MICNDPACGCAIESETLAISGSGTPDDPWVVEQIEFAVLTDLENAVANLAAELNLLPGIYVAKAGDTMTGTLVINGTAASLSAMRASDAPFVEFLQQSGTRIGYLQGSAPSTFLDLHAEAGIYLRFVSGAAEAARILTSGILLVGKTASNIATTGAEIQPASIWLTRSTNGSNYASNKTGAADVNAGIHFLVQSAGTTIGSITRATSTTTAYNTSSDEEWKQNIVEVDDQLALYWMRVVQPMLFEFIKTPGDIHVGYIAQRVAAAWPESITLGVVTPGHGNIADRTFDDDGNETTPDEVYRSWQIDLSKFVPFIHAGLQAVDVRVSILEDIIGGHAIKIEQLVDEVADLREDLTALQAVVVTLSGG